MLRPIPDTANGTDIEWEAEFTMLAHELTEEGLRTKAIIRWTKFSRRHVLRIHYAKHGRYPSSGPMQLGTAARFVTDRGSQRRSGAVVNLQAALFLRSFVQLRNLMDEPMNMGWMLLTAYRSYRLMSTPQAGNENDRRLDINDCYAILHHAGILSREAELKLAICNQCLGNYLVFADSSRVSPSCPVCEMDHRYERSVARCATMGRGSESKRANRVGG